MQQEFFGKPMLYWIIQKDGLEGLWVENPRRIVKKREGDVEVNASYLSHASNSVISSSLACIGMSPNLHLSLLHVKHYLSLNQYPRLLSHYSNLESDGVT